MLQYRKVCSRPPAPVSLWRQRSPTVRPLASYDCRTIGKAWHSTVSDQLEVVSCDEDSGSSKYEKPKNTHDCQTKVVRECDSQL